MLRRLLLVAVVCSGLGVAGVGLLPIPATAQAATWQHVLTAARVLTLRTDPTQPTHVYAGGVATLTTNGATTGVGSIFQSTDSGTTWSRTDVDQGVTIVNDLAVVPSQPQTLYLASSFNGIFKSANGGAAWTSQNAGLPGASPSMFSLAIDPTATTTLYAAGIVGGRSSVFKSTDGGAAWQRLNVTSAACDLRAVVIAPSAPQTLFVGAGCGVFKSQDGGGTWQQLAGAPNTIEAIAVSPADPNRVYAASDASGLSRTTDGGATWQALNAGSRADAVAINPTNPSTVYVAGFASPGNPSVQVSQDGGDTWAQLGGAAPTTELHALLAVGSTLLLGGGTGGNAGGVWQIGVSSAPAPTSVPHDNRYFGQTGYRIDNDAIWDYFNRRGGVPTFGYPTSRTFTLQGFTVQFFQRRIVQLGPDGKARLLNLLDSGLMPYTRFNGSSFPGVDSGLVATAPAPTNQPAVLAWVQAHAPDSVNGSPTNYYATFRNTVTAAVAFPNGGDPSLLPGFDLEMWGVPTSGASVDPNNHHFIYLRWQRGIMHYDAGCACTQGILLADYFKAILTGRNLPADVAQESANSPFRDQYDPSAPNWVRNPSLLPNTDLMNAFTPE